MPLRPPLTTLRHTAPACRGTAAIRGVVLAATMLTSGLALAQPPAAPPVAQPPAAQVPAQPAASPASPAPSLAGDIDAGQRVFMKCRACHQVGEGAKHTAGPDLNGLIGRKAGVRDGYRFSDAMKSSGLTWDVATLRSYLKSPRAKVPGTRMIFLGLPRDKEIEDLLAYLGQFDADGKTSR